MLNENEQPNKTQDSKDITVPGNVSDVSFLRDNPNLLYLYKKTEKLVSAVYLISNYISDREPLKWQLRETGLSLSSFITTSANREADFTATGLKFLSFLEISHTTGIISEMNFNILKHELSLLIRTAEAGRGEPKGQISQLVIPEHFFEVEKRQEQNNMSDRLSIKKSEMVFRPGEQKQKDKTNRQGIILSLLAKGNELGIKDFVSSIKDCSEKTIQRELASLISKGQIKKQGEKRWSRYSIRA